MFAAIVCTFGSVAQAQPGAVDTGSLGLDPSFGEGDGDRWLMLHGGAVHTDNLDRSPGAGESLLFGVVGADLGWLHDSRRVAASLESNLQYHHYGRERFSNEVVGGLDAGLTLKLVPNLFDWNANNRFGQVRADPFRAQGPGNRGYVNEFSTGPDVFLPLGRRTSLNLGLRFADRRYERSDRLDSQQYSGQAELARAMSATQTLAVGATSRRVDYRLPTAIPGSPTDGPNGSAAPASAVDFHSAWLRHHREFARGTFTLRGGVNQSRMAGESETGLLARIDWNRALTPRSRIFLEAGRELTEAGSMFFESRLERDLVSDLDNPVLSGDPLTRTRLGGGYVFQRARSSLELRSDWSQERHVENVALDRELISLRAGFRYRMRPALIAGIGGVYREEFFNVAATRAHESMIGATLDWGIGTQLGLRLSHEYRDRRVRGGEGGYHESRWGLFVTWVPGGPGQP